MTMCFCGRPARRKYCSDQCARRACSKRIRSRPEYKKRMRAYLREWHAKNPEKRKIYADRIPKEVAKERKRQEYLRRRDKHRAKAKEYYLKNAEAIKAKVREWRAKNLEYAMKKRAEYRRKNKAILAAKQKARYHDYYRPVARAYRKKNAAKLKEQMKKYRETHAAEIAANRKAYWESMNLEAKRRMQRKYRCKARRKKLELEFSLLSGMLSKASSTSETKPRSKAPKN